MSKFNFPAVLAKSPSEALTMLGIDEGAILEYSPASGMYVTSDEGKDVEESYFANAVGFSKAVIDALLESGAVEELVVPETTDATSDEEGEVDQWDKADLTMVCGRCGAEEKVTEAIGGATLFMPTTSKAETRLVCSECGNTMALRYRNGSMMTDEEKAEFEAKRAEAQAKQEQERDTVNEVPVDLEDQPKMEIVTDDDPITEDNESQEASK